jgi:hypothetical protein
VVSVLSHGQAEMGRYECWNVSLHWEQSAFYIQLECGAIVAALSYHKLADRSCYWIDMGYVVPSHRQGGLYGILYNALTEKAKKENIKTVEGEVSISNKPMIAVAKSQGRIATSTRWVAKVGAC